MPDEGARIDPNDPRPDDPALRAVRALVAAADRPMAVFDDVGSCLVANRGFVLWAARNPTEPAQDQAELSRHFSPDGIRSWSLVTAPSEATQRSAALFIDTIANALPVMFNAKDRSSRYLFMNRYQAELYGTTPEGAVGRTAGELLGQAYGSYTHSLDAEVLSRRRPLPFYEEAYPSANGALRYWLTSKVPLADSDGTVWGVATVAVDISERKRLEEGLRIAKEGAEAANRAKSRFLATMSHELRTPLHAVIAVADLMRNESHGPLGAPEYLEYIDHLAQAGERLLTLVSDVLDYARTDSGMLHFEVEEVDVATLVDEAVAAVGAAAAVKHVAVGLVLPDQAAGRRVVLQADRQRLLQVLAKLLDNAVKFSTSGGRIQVVVVGLPQGGAEIRVEDTGIGIAAENLPRIFEPFWQADAGLSRVHDGAGLGLALTRELVAMHGGRLDVESHPGEGTVVRVTLPQAPPGGKTERVAV